MAQVVAGLAQIVHEHPYLRPMGTERAPHHLLFWVRSCRESIIANHIEDAKGFLERVSVSLAYEMAQVADSFRRFDVDNSGKLDSKEFRYMCAYIGWGEEEASLMDVDDDGFVTLAEFKNFVGDSGGLSAIFEHRRQRVARKQWGVEAPSVLEVGSRVRSYFHTPDGKKSENVREGQILELRVMPNNGVLIDFVEEGGKGNRQVVPQSWIFSDTRDSDVVAALREVGILEEQQAFWAAIFPESEMRAVEKLVPCQRAALYHVRANATASHEAAMPELRKRFENLGHSERELQACLGWVQDLAPTVVHIHIDRVGTFLETDEYYRSQFETGTSSGALDGKNAIRKRWEMELFGGTYEDAKPFERCKYGALGVMNDFRGVTSAYGYGDSYLVLKDVRLRCTFASTDSGGISGQRLAVLDKYAHVLKEYSDDEMRSLIDVAMSNTSLQDMPQVHPTLLRGMSEDPMENWITVGFPHLAQKRGRFFFEVELYSTCSSPQVGVLSTDFVAAPRNNSFLGGVGDDDEGWGADGQHAILWHKGERLPFDCLWPSDGGSLTADVVVGVAVDLDRRQIFFATNGEWRTQPDFDESHLRKNLSLYPALSVRGRAGFNFGPNFKHSGPSYFSRWPGGGDVVVRVDCPILGNSHRLRVYKEIQIHGEVSLKRNVQRLVANKKFLEKQKSERTWAIRVDGLEPEFNGPYQRAGARNSMPLYVKNGTSAAIYFSAKEKEWRIVQLSDADVEKLELEDQKILAHAPKEPKDKDDMSPPREGWERPPEIMGYVPVEDFRSALKKGSMENEASKLIEALRGTVDGEEVIFRSGRKTTLEAQWEKLSNPGMGVEATWSSAVEVSQERLMNKMGLSKCKVVETAHPYETAEHSFTKTVSIDTEGPIEVHFGQECRTYDHRTTLCVYGGGLSKALVGVGARVHVKVPTGQEQAHGTIIGRSEGGRWKVRVDKDEAEICGCFKEWIESSDNGRERYCTSCVAEEQRKCVVDYYDGETPGSEIAGFKLDPADPLSPFSISGFIAKGPAQMDGVMVGWFLDVGALLQEESFIEMEMEGLGPVPSNMTEVANNMDDFQKRLNAMLTLTDISLTFVNGLDFQLLPQSRVKYEQEEVGSEISGFTENGGVITIDGFSSPSGPAQQSGARVGWQLNLPETFDLPVNKGGKLSDVSQDDVIKDPTILLILSEVMLVFEPSNFEPEQYFNGCGQGQDVWKRFKMPINTAQFVFTTDGDRGGWCWDSDPKRRYGFLAVVTPGGSEAPAEAKVQELMASWGEKATKAKGKRSKITVEPEDWDEARLRALCARHGWEFEWMTEDGERRRRIEGAQRARKVAQKCTKDEGTGAWWRLSSVTAAFGATTQKKEQRKIMQMQAQVEEEEKEKAEVKDAKGTKGSKKK